MKSESLARLADLVIRIMIMFTSIVALYYFATIFNQTMFTILIWIFLLALIVKGITSVIIVAKRRKANEDMERSKR